VHRHQPFLAAAAASLLMLLAACNAPRLTENEADLLRAGAEVAIDDFEREIPDIRDRLDSAYAYAIFPRISKGAAIVGGARGSGLVYEQGELIGNAVVAQTSIGAQLGGSAYREIILFADERALERLTSGKLEFSARGSAVAGTAGGTGDIDYDDGVEVYALAINGLLIDASLGGQDFDFRPIDN